MNCTEQWGVGHGSVCGNPLIPLIRSYPIYVLPLSALKRGSTQSEVEQVLLSSFLAQNWMWGSADTGYLTASLFWQSCSDLGGFSLLSGKIYSSRHLHSIFLPPGAGWDVRQQQHGVAPWHSCSALCNGIFTVSFTYCSAGNVLLSAGVQVGGMWWGIISSQMLHLLSVETVLVFS